MVSLQGDLWTVSVARNIKLLVVGGLLRAHTPIILDSHMQPRIDEIRLDLYWLLTIHENRLML